MVEDEFFIVMELENVLTGSGFDVYRSSELGR